MQLAGELVIRSRGPHAKNAGFGSGRGKLYGWIKGSVASILQAHVADNFKIRQPCDHQVAHTFVPDFHHTLVTEVLSIIYKSCAQSVGAGSNSPDSKTRAVVREFSRARHQ